MPDLHDAEDPGTEQRFTDVEIKLAFLEDQVEQLNAVVIRQQDQLDLLVREVSRLRQEAAAAGTAGFRSLRDELPPHY